MTNVKALPLSHARPSDTLLDCMTFLRISSQILSEGDISDEYAAEVSWMLGSFKKRLEPLLDLVERLEEAGAIDMTPEAFQPALPAAAASTSPGFGDAFAEVVAFGLNDPNAMIAAIKAEKARRKAKAAAEEDLAIIDDIDAARVKLGAILKEVSA